MLKPEELEKYLEKWPTWIAILFLFIPGALYQIYNIRVDPSLYSGLSIIIFLILSLYYSLPYIVIGFLYFSVIEPGKEGLDERNFLAVSLISVLSYALISFIYNIQGGFPFYYLSWIFIILFFIFAIIANFRFEKKKKNLKRN